MRQSVEKKASENKSRYTAYLQTNPSLSRPNLYDRYVPSHKLIPVIRLRTISHDLEMERARLMKHLIPQDQRLCTCGEVEDEKHFILHCSNYTHVREKYDDITSLPFYEQLDNINTPDFVHDLNQNRDLYLRRSRNRNTTM